MHEKTRRTGALAGGLLLVAGTQSAVASSSPDTGSAGAAGAAGAVRAAKTAVHVQGTQVPVHPKKGVYAMRGDLVGKWVVTPGQTLHDSKTLLVLSGTERFRGCIDDNHDKSCGTGEAAGLMNFAFLYWASFTKSGQLIRGQCVHPVTGGTKSFAGARGVLRMVDHPHGDSVRTTYRGRVVLRGNANRAAPAAAHSASAATAGLRASARAAC